MCCWGCEIDTTSPDGYRQVWSSSRAHNDADGVAQEAQAKAFAAALTANGATAVTVAQETAIFNNAPGDWIVKWQKTDALLAPRPLAPSSYRPESWEKLDGLSYAVAAGFVAYNETQRQRGRGGCLPGGTSYHRPHLPHGETVGGGAVKAKTDKHTVHPGHVYVANVSGQRCRIRLDGPATQTLAGLPSSGWTATNLKTGRKVTIGSARRLFGVAKNQAGSSCYCLQPTHPDFDEVLHGGRP